MQTTTDRNFRPARVFRRGDRFRSALMLVELCMGMVVMALVLGGVAAFSLAMSSVWSDSESSQATCLSTNQATLRLERIFRTARRFGYCRSGNLDGTGAGATLVFWAQDGDPDRGTSADSYMQESEVQLVEYNATTHTLDLYEEPLTMPVGAKWPSTVIADANFPATFKSGLTPKTLASGVQGVHFTVDSSSTYIAPTLKYDIRLSRSGVTSTQSGTVTLRGPASQPY